MANSAVVTLVQYGASLRRFGASPLARYLVIGAGLIAMTAFTVPDLRGVAGPWLSACLWCCLAYFVLEGGVRVGGAAAAGGGCRFLLSLAGVAAVLDIYTGR